jgi:hypothetical protein
LAAALPADALAVSIAAGITSAQLDRWLGGDAAGGARMPNTPALLGAGATGLFANPAVDATASARRGPAAAVGHHRVDRRRGADGRGHRVSGSGPAYVFLLAEAMQAAGEAAGPAGRGGARLTAQTLLGAARMLCEGAEPAPTLRARVTSPGGTTQAAIEASRPAASRGWSPAAIAAATRRGAELAARPGGAMSYLLDAAVLLIEVFFGLAAGLFVLRVLLQLVGASLPQPDQPVLLPGQQPGADARCAAGCRPWRRLDTGRPGDRLRAATAQGRRAGRCCWRGCLNLRRLAGARPGRPARARADRHRPVAARHPLPCSASSAPTAAIRPCRCWRS